MKRVYKNRAARAAARKRKAFFAASLEVMFYGTILLMLAFGIITSVYNIVN